MKTVCVIESAEDFRAFQKFTPSVRGEFVCYCSCTETQTLMTEAGISFVSLTEDLFSSEWDEINQWAKKLSLRWFEEAPFSEALRINGLNLGNIFNRPISHALIYRLKNQLLANILLSKERFDSIILFEQFEKRGLGWKKAEGTINDAIARKFGSRSICIRKMPSFKGRKKRSWTKETARSLISFLHGITQRFRTKVVFVGMGMMKYLLPLLSRLKNQSSTVFVDEDFHFDTYNACKRNGIYYAVASNLVQWEKGLALRWRLFKWKRTLKRLKPLIQNSDWFVYKNERLLTIGEAMIETLSTGTYQRLSQQLVCKTLFEKLGAKALILHEDVDAFRTAALTARQLRIPVAVLSHGIPPTPNDWSDSAANIGVADLIVNSEFEKDKYLMTGYPPELIHVLGLPRYDLIFKKTRREAIPSRREKTVLYCPHMLTRVTKPKKGYLGIHTPGGVTRQNSISVMKACQEVGCVLRIKPHANSEDIHLWDKLIRQYGGRSTVLVSHRSDIFDLLAECDLVIATFSTVVIEGMLFGKNVITINFTGRPHLHPYAKRGIALGVYEPAELADAIRKCLFDNETSRRLHHNRLREMEYFGGHFDGNSTERVMNYLQSLIDMTPEKAVESATHEGILT